MWPPLWTICQSNNSDNLEQVNINLFQIVQIESKAGPPFCLFHNSSQIHLVATPQSIMLRDLAYIISVNPKKKRSIQISRTNIRLFITQKRPCPASHNRERRRKTMKEQLFLSPAIFYVCLPSASPPRS
jgi:hypothetical protein